MEHIKIPETNKHENDSDCPPHVRGDRHAGKSRAKTVFQLQNNEKGNAKIAKKKKIDSPSKWSLDERHIQLHLKRGNVNQNCASDPVKE